MPVAKKYKLLITPESKIDLQTAKNYYHEKQSGLEKRFVKVVK